MDVVVSPALTEGLVEVKSSVEDRELSKRFDRYQSEGFTLYLVKLRLPKLLNSRGLRPAPKWQGIERAVFPSQ